MSWEQLQNIEEDRRVEVDRDKTVAPSACPNDGTPLVTAFGGVLHCSFDGWQYPRDAQQRGGFIA